MSRCPVCDRANHTCYFTGPYEPILKENRMADIIASETLYATADGRVVREGDPDAATLIAREGTRVTADTVDQYKLSGDAHDEGAVLRAQEEERRKTLSRPSHGPQPTGDAPSVPAGAASLEGTSMPAVEQDPGADAEDADSAPRRRR